MGKALGERFRESLGHIPREELLSDLAESAGDAALAKAALLIVSEDRQADYAERLWMNELIIHNITVELQRRSFEEADEED